jgi:hypothetical protein
MISLGRATRKNTGAARALEHWAVRDDLGMMLQAGLIGGPPS